MDFSTCFPLSLKLRSFCFMVCFRDVGFFGSETFVDCLLVLHSTLSLPPSLSPSLSLVLDMEVFLSLCFSSQLSRSLPVWELYIALLSKFELQFSEHDDALRIGCVLRFKVGVFSCMLSATCGVPLCIGHFRCWWVCAFNECPFFGVCLLYS